MKKRNRKPQIPGYFEYLEKKGSRAVPLYPLKFVVKEEAQYFVLAGKKIGVDSFRSRRFDKNLEGVEKNRIAYSAMPDHPLLVSDRAMIIAGPKLHNYVKLFGSRSLELPTLRKLGLAATARDNGLVDIWVEDSSASIGPAIISNDLQQPVEKGFAEYAITGDSDRDQRLLLYAGLGYVANLALKQD